MRARLRRFFTARAGSGPWALQLALILPAIAALTLSVSVDHAQVHRLERAPRASGYGTDTVYVYGPTRFYGASSSVWALYDDTFNADSLAGWRYYATVTTGSPGVSNAMLSVNGQQYIGSGEFGGGGTRWLDNPDVVLGANGLDISVKGATNTYVDVTAFRVKDPTFSIFGRTTYTRLSSIGTQTDTFSLPPGAEATYTLSMINGAPAGQNRATNTTLKINGTQVLGSTDFKTGVATVLRQVSLLSSDTLSILNQGAAGSFFSVRFTATDTTAPVVAVAWPPEGLLTEADTVHVVGSVTDETPGLLNVNGRPWMPIPGAFSDLLSFTSDGNYTLAVHAVNSAKRVTDVVRHWTRDTHAPTLTIRTLPADTLSETLPIAGWWADTTTTTVTVDGDTVGIGRGGAISLSYPLDLGPNGILFRAVDALGHKTEFKRYVFRNSQGEPTSPDSTLTTSVLDPTAISSFLDAAKFLYTLNQPPPYSQPIQTGVDASKITPDFAAVLHGQVTSRDYGGLGGVTVTVLGHPEFGQTISRKDGRFDLVVNGGTQLVLRFNRPGYLEGQRIVFPKWNEYAMVDSIAMIGLTARRTVVTPTNATVARGRFKTDDNGDRDIRLFFPQGTVAKVVRAPGDTVSFSNGFRVRATEYTVGSDGRSSMPGVLPPASAYTYCVDLTLDEADSLRLSGQPEPAVVFSQPVPRYVRNFLHLPVGANVPAGSYDATVGQWKASRDGCVMRILSTSGGVATIDSDGDGLPDNYPGPDSLTTAELTGLAQEYAPNDTLWRMVSDHFSPDDYNINMAQVRAQQSPRAGRAGQNFGLVEDCTECEGSIVQVENRTLGERIPVVGTPYVLNYRSYRAPGDEAIRTLRIPVSQDTVPAGTQRIVVLLDVAGRRLRQEFSQYTTGLTNQVASIAWDGKDVFGRTVQGSVNAVVSIGYQYAVTYAASSGGTSLGDPAATGAPLLGASANREVGRISWLKRRVSLGAPSAASDGLGGWTISPHHFYDVTGRGALYFGDGSVRLFERNYPYLTIAIDNVLANDLALGPDGSIYTSGSYGIYKFVGGNVQQIAGGSHAGQYVDGVPATQTLLSNPRQLAIGPDGSVYFVMNDANGSCTNCQRACRIATDGTIHTVAGTGTKGASASGDGGPATSANLVEPVAIALGPDGCVYVGDHGTYSVRRVAPNGIITTYAGTRSSGNSDSTGVATSIRLTDVHGLCADDVGNLYIAELAGQRVRKVAPDGIMTIAVSSSDPNFWPEDVVIGPDGGLYIATGAGYLINGIYRLDPDGTLNIVAGGVDSGSPVAGYDTPALGANLGNPNGIDVASDGSLYVSIAVQIKRISPVLPGSSLGEISVPSEDGSEIYSFSLGGRHLRTRDALTGGVRFRFVYDAGGRLHAIYDASGDSTIIQRAPDGTPQTIVAPYGQVTQLALDGNGYLKTVTNPALQTVTLNADASGLLQNLTDGENHQYTYTYGSDGRLSQDQDPAGGSQTLVAAFQGLTRTVTRTTGENRLSQYSVTDLYDGTRQRKVLDLNQVLSRFDSDSADARTRLWTRQGLSVTDSLGPEPRFTMLAPMVLRSSERLPGGIVRTTEVSHVYSVSPAKNFNPPFVNGTWTENQTLNGRAPLVTQFNSAVSPGVLTTTSPTQRTTIAAVDSAARPLSVTISGLSPLTMTYDTRGRLTKVEQGGRGWRYSYDANGRLAVIRDTLHRTIGFGYDAADRPTSQTLSGGQVVQFGYDNNGNLTSVTPPGRPAHGFDYTPVNLTSRYRPPVAGLPVSQTQYVYNKDRQLTEVDRPDGGTVTLGYDALGRLASVTTPRGSSALTYDNAARLSGLTSPDAVTLSLAYDGPVDTLETWSGAISGSVSVALDRDFRVGSQRVNGGSTVVFGYDADGLLTNAGSLAITRRADNGLVAGTTLGSVTTSESQTSVGERWKYEAKYEGTLLFGTTYDRDSVGRITQVTEMVQGVTKLKAHAYSDTGFLKTVTEDGTVTGRYAYDGNGNRTRFEGAAAGDSATGTYDDQDRLLRYKDTRYSYTAAGELAMAVTGTDTTLYTYDPLGNLVTVVLPNYDRIDYLIDGMNRRVGRKLNGHALKAWLYEDDLRPVAELDSTGAVVSRFVYGLDENVPEYLVRGGSTYRLVKDHLGSVRLVVDVSTGGVAQRLDYDAWGQVLLDTQPGFQPFGFAGGLYDTATKLVRFGPRDYDASVGRWPAKDPIVNLASLGLGYEYCSSDPVNRSDPWGTKDCPILTAGLSWALPRLLGFESNIVIVYDPSTGQLCSYWVYGGGAGPSINALGFALTAQVGAISGKNRCDICGGGWEVSGFAAAGWGVSAEVSGGGGVHVCGSWRCCGGRGGCNGSWNGGGEDWLHKPCVFAV